MCLYPKLIENRRYKANKKNRGVIPPIFDKRALYVPVKCGKCMECKKQKAREWQVRLHEEIREDKTGKFVTLTFSNESLIELEEKLQVKVKTGIKKIIKLKNGKERKYYNYKKVTGAQQITGYNLDNAIAKKGIRLFLERWRKKHGRSVKHWLTTELGQTATERIHIHGIIFSNEKEDIQELWKYGRVDIGSYVNAGSINYIVKYLSKTDKKHKEYIPIICTSAGIGKGYMNRQDAKLNKYKGEKTKETYTTRKGVQIALPIYYRNKIFTEEEKEKLWIIKLDKEERYINGQRVDISKGEEEYYKLLKEERRKNQRLGYGNDKINWERRKYENERRNLQKKAIRQIEWAKQRK